MMKESRKGYDLLVRGRNAAAGCSPTWTGSMGRETHCGNLLWQLCRTVYPSVTIMSDFLSYNLSFERELLKDHQRGDEI